MATVDTGRPALLEEKAIAYHEDVKSASSSEGFLPIDVVAEKKLLRKIDLRVVPPLVFLFLLAFLDRVNIGNAKIQGMTEELHMKGNEYNIALFIFFVPYILLEVPANLVIKQMAPSTWLCSIMFCWGVITIGQGLIRNFAGLVAMRFLLGIFEAGLVPGSVYLISMWYKRFELQWRLSVFFCASIMAGAFGGLLSYLLAKMDGVGGYSGWRWIFIIEGLMTVVCSFLFKAWIVDWPENEKFLTQDERALIVRRLAEDASFARMDNLDKRAAKRIFGDWKVYCGVFMYMGIVNTGYAVSFFTPTIIRQLGYTSAASQIRSIPVFMVAAVLSLATAWLADKYKRRYSFAIVGICVCAIGYIILLLQEHVGVGVRYLACFLIVGGGFMTQPITWAWLSNNVAGHYKRSIATALQIGIGNSGGIVASNIFITKQAPKYPVGYGTSLGMLMVCALACTVFFFGLRAENKKRDAGGRDYRYTEGAEQLNNMGDDHPQFRFIT